MSEFAYGVGTTVIGLVGVLIVNWAIFKIMEWWGLR